MKTMLLAYSKKFILDLFYVFFLCMVHLLELQKKYKYPVLARNILWLGFSTMVISLVISLFHPSSSGISTYHSLVIDNTTLLLRFFVIMSAAMSIMLSLDYVKDESINAFEYTPLIILATMSMIWIVSSNDIITLYLSIELQSLCLYALAASKRTSEFSTEAGLKYFILGALSSSILLLGCAFTYSLTSTTSFEDLALLTKSMSLSDEVYSLLFAMMLVTASLMFKLAAVPFHMWSPDVYESAPLSVTSFFALAPKAALFSAIIRLLCHCMYDSILMWQTIILISSIMSMVWSAFSAISQIRLKRILAYSSISHVSYLFLSLSCSTIESIQALFVYLFLYIVTTVVVFSILISLRQQNQPLRAQYISDLSRMAYSNSAIAFSFSIAMFSMASIPPLASFCSKIVVFIAAMNSHLYVAAVISVLASVISTFYYIRLVKTMYFDNMNNSISYKPMSKESALLVSSSTLMLVFFVFYPSPLFVFSHQAALTFISLYF